MEQVGLIPGVQGSFQPIQITMWYSKLTNKIKDNNHMIISIGAEKASDRIQHPLFMKTPGDKESTQPNENLYDKPSENVLLNFCLLYTSDAADEHRDV